MKGETGALHGQWCDPGHREQQWPSWLAPSCRGSAQPSGSLSWPPGAGERQSPPPGESWRRRKHRRFNSATASSCSCQDFLRVRVLTRRAPIRLNGAWSRGLQGWSHVLARRCSPALPVAAGQRSCSCERGTWTAAGTQQAGLDLQGGDEARVYF